MTDTPKDLYYTKTHEWLKQNDDGTVTLGITDYAQKQLGELVFVELPEPTANFEVGAEVCVVESVKTASDVFMPIAGDVVEVNLSLMENPGTVNESPYSDGWLIKINPSDWERDSAALSNEPCD